MRTVVSLFKRLLNFPRETLARLRDKRRARRYPLGPGFELEASVNLIGSDSLVRIRQAAGSGCRWGGRVVDLSASGLRVMLPAAAITVRGEVTLVTLTISRHQLTVPCEVAHFRVHNHHSIAGLKLQFGDDEAQRAYLQLVEVAATGATLEPARLKVKPAVKGLLHEGYRSDNGVELHAWRAKKGATLQAFEFLFPGYCLRGETGRPGLEVFSPGQGGAGGTAWAAPDHVLCPGAHGEVRQYFRWVALNAGPAVPADLRALLTRCAS